MDDREFSCVLHEILHKIFKAPKTLHKLLGKFYTKGTKKTDFKRRV